MDWTHLKASVRLLRRHSAFTSINVGGLAVGMAACVLIALYVSHEAGYDRFHERSARIYRLYNQPPGGDAHGRTPHPLGPALQAEFADVEAAVRFRRGAVVVHQAAERFREDSFFFTDPAVFEVFSLGDGVSVGPWALDAPGEVVLTESAARRYFGQDDGVGRTLAVSGFGDMVITGVIPDLPAQSHFQFEVLASYSTLAAADPVQMEAWDNFVTSTYVLLRERADADHFRAELSSLLSNRLSGADGEIRLGADRLNDVHLRRHLSGDLGPGGSLATLYLFASVGLLILIIAVVNFVSLSTARTSERARELGIRQVLGATRPDLVRQVLGEAILVSLVAGSVAVLLVQTVAGPFASLLGLKLTMPSSFVLSTLVLGFAAVVGLIAGVYPAWLLSAGRPKLSEQPGSGRAAVRQVLTACQFGLATTLVIGVLVMTRQLDYVAQKDLGFDAERVVVVSLQAPGAWEQAETMKSVLLTNPDLISASASYHTPGRGLGTYQAVVEGSDEVIDIATYITDMDFVETERLQVVQGRALSEDRPGDEQTGFMINEAAARAFGWSDPLGKHVRWDGTKEGRVVGVIQDFHFQSLHEAIAPLLLHVDPAYFRRLSVRIREGADLDGALRTIAGIYAQFDPEHPFEYTFLDQDFAIQYASERRTAGLVGWAAGLAILVACIGLLGLALFTAERRMREIGVRKVLGASVSQIVVLLSGDFARVLLVGLLLAVPGAWWLTGNWLESFAYRTPVGPGTLLLGCGVALAAALLSIGVQALRAARLDPVRVLRDR